MPGAMKRKFAFLAPLRIPSKAEHRALKAHLETHGTELVSPLSTYSLDSPPLSGFIDRRELDYRTEAQLKAACAAVVKGYVDEPEAKLNFKPLSHTKSVPHLNGSSTKSSSRPQTSGQVESRIPPVPHLAKVIRSVSNSKSVQDFRQINHTPRQNMPNSKQKLHDRETRQHPGHADPRKNTTFSPITQPQKPVPPHDESDGSYETPRTASTDRHVDSSSTAFTSTAITPSRPPERFSGHQVEQLEHSSHDRHSNHRDSKSRTKHIDVLRPNTAIDGRPMRRDSLELRSVHAQSFGRGFNNYGNIASHVHDNGRSSIEGTHFDDVRYSGSIIDLNRALPPLPKLDTWKRHTGASTAYTDSTSTSPSEPMTHVVDLMRRSGLRAELFTSEPQPQQPAMTTATSARPNPPPKDETVSSNMGRSRSTAHSKSSSTADSCFSPSIRSRAQSGSLRDTTIREDGPYNPTKSPTHSHHTLLSDAVTATSGGTRMSLSRNADGSIPNFSRKISLDMQGAIRSQTVATPVETGDFTALPPMPVQKHRVGGLRRVLSSLALGQGYSRKSTLTWMDHFEAEGIKTGIMVPRKGRAAAPIIRY